MVVGESGKDIILIAGMHRSGTSYLTKSFNLLGMQLPQSIAPGADDNPKGHFESFLISQYHESLLNHMELAWDTFILPTDEWFLTAEAEQAVVGLCDALNRDYPKTEHVVLKDPRISLFVPLWNDVVDRLGMQGSYVIPFRHPFEVAASLFKRNKISRARTINLACISFFSGDA